MKAHQKRVLDKGKTEKLVGALRAIKSRHSEVAEKIRTEADYFASNAERMRYPKFRRQHLFVGSGVIEARCKTVVVPVSSAQECSGPCGEPTPSWLSDAHFSTAASRIIGRTAGQLWPLKSATRSDGKMCRKTT
jgi:hypothetical protein